MESCWKGTVATEARARSSLAWITVKAGFVPGKVVAVTIHC
jgi:hypothetical protein